MDEWEYYFGAVASIRFHPRNEIKDIDKEVEFAAKVADAMIREKEKRWQLQQQQ